MAKALSETIRTEIVSLYLSGLSSREVEEKLLVSKNGVKNALKRRAIKAHGHGEWRRLNVKHDFFDVIDSETKAYWLGFLAADGNVCGNKIGLTVSEKDKKHLDLFKATLESGHKIALRKARECFDKYLGKPSYTLSIRSSHMVETLYRHGIQENKTLSLKWPTTIPSRLLRHYVRGVLDGDGSIYINSRGQVNLSFTGLVSFLSNLRDHLSLFCGVSKPKPYSRAGLDNKFGLINWGGHKQIQRILDYLYTDATIFLTRKIRPARKQLAMLGYT
jgi:hypothetical protein